LSLMAENYWSNCGRVRIVIMALLYPS